MIGRKVSEMILDGKELEFYKWGGDGLDASLASVKEKLNAAAGVEPRGEGPVPGGNREVVPALGEAPQAHRVSLTSRVFRETSRRRRRALRKHETFFYTYSRVLKTKKLPYTEASGTALRRARQRSAAVFFTPNGDAPPGMRSATKSSSKYPPPRSKLCLRSSVLAASAE